MHLCTIPKQSIEDTQLHRLASTEVDINTIDCAENGNGVKYIKYLQQSGMHRIYYYIRNKEYDA